MSALPELPKASCYWDPSVWRADGEKNICSDGAPFSTKNLPASAVGKYFNTDPTKLKNPQNIEGGTPNVCFQTYGIALDPLSNEMVKAFINCVRARDLAFDQSISTQYLGGGDLLKSTFSWDFGDSNSAYNQVKGFNAAHIYSTTGSKTITLTVKNEMGLVGIAKFSVSVQPDNRVPVLINSDADLAKLNISSAPAQGRHIVFKSGVTYHIPGSISLFTNDWMSSDGTAPAILLTQSGSTLFTAHGSSHTLVENVSVQGNGTGWIATGYGNNQAFRNIPFSKVAGGFQPGDSGVLIQNTGMPKAADGSWQSNHITANFILHSVKGLSFYGNHAYLVKADWNREPAVRANGGHYISMIGNEIGGYTGKNDQVSIRGAKYIYFGSNEMRGGVFNIQVGTSPNPQPGAMPNALVMENNILENLGFETSGSVPNVMIRNNLFHIHGDSDTAYNLLYPRPNPHNINLNGGPYGTSGLLTNNIRIENNALELDQNSGSPIVFYGPPKTVQLIGNRILSPFKNPIQGNGAGLSTFSETSGNIFYLNANVPVTDIAGAQKIADWNLKTMALKREVMDQLALPSLAPMKAGELAVPTPIPTPAPTPSPTPSPSPTPAPVTKDIWCRSWSYAYKECAIGLSHPQSITMKTSETPTLCPATNFGIKGLNIFVQHGCRAEFLVTGY